jgi:hypothetical protein
VNVTLSSNRFLLQGGDGGTGPTHGSGEFSKAGDGGVGLLRVEDNTSGSALFGPIAQTVDAFDPTVINQADPAEATAAIHWLSADVWDPSDEVPGSFSAAQSCWMEPGGNIIGVTFDGDNLPGDPGWDMQIFLGGPTPVSYRTSTVFGGNSPQVEWGELFNDGTNPGAPVVVRFQGAQATGALADPCNAEPGGPLSQIDPESITPWVRHPEELNAFNNPPVNIIRFMILFDAAHPQFGTIQGITNVVIDGIPE